MFSSAVLAVLVLLSLVSSDVQGFTLISKPTFENLNNRPIVGILSQEYTEGYGLETLGKFKSYIAASYVKFIEGGGAQVVPIW